jgi:mTERF domain-containing protein, mitochondrial
LPGIGKKLGNVNEILTVKPELNRYAPEVWQSTHDFLSHEGFNSHKFPEMILTFPKLLTIPRENLQSSIVGWRGFQFGQKETIKLLEKYPELLEIQPNKHITMRIDMISNFVGGGSQIFQLIVNSPGVISQPVPLIKEKIDYLKMVMKVPTIEVYKSAAFSLDIHDLKTRHIFLKRLGLYIARKKPEDISKNPQLYHITDTSDRRFATKVCHVTLEEFETFQEIYKRELFSEREEFSDEEEREDEN